jgi:CheY-like chemotaxis protein
MSVSASAQVLVVDDDAGIRETIRLILEASGYAVAEAHDGAEALERLRAGTVRYVVVLDYTLPHLDGPTLLRTLEADPALAGRHAAALVSARREVDEPELRDLCARLGVPILPKPFEMDELLDTVAALARRLASPPPAP